MPGVNKEQIARAKEWDLLSYMQRYEPDELVRTGPHEYSAATHGSLKISNGKWHWFKEDMGGKDALSYLVHVRNMGFVEAVELLSDGVGRAPPLPPQPIEPRKPFCLPEAARFPAHVLSYLQGRGIGGEIVQACIEANILYESRKYHNCVFVGLDPAGIARYAALRGTYGDFKQEVESSDKRYGFVLPPRFADCPRVVAAESPIDALSVAQLQKLQSENWRDCAYLSLGCTAARALLQYLQDHPAINTVEICVDNDEAGIKGATGLQRAVMEDESLKGRSIRLIFCPPPRRYGKDYNNMLVAKRQRMRGREQKRAAVRQAAR
ncbi:MAG: DUF3991 and TOPRIM domain-containing protein [Ethanoligenens sp.]|uniref:DUF3991 domain-containing protein n=1 Tax=Ethanoligenens sp. TaxID=2099655 RepID=UPI0039E7574D